MGSAMPELSLEIFGVDAALVPLVLETVRWVVFRRVPLSRACPCRRRGRIASLSNVRIHLISANAEWRRQDFEVISA